MIVAESFGSFSPHAQNVNKALMAYNGIFETKNITNFMPFMPKAKDENIFPPLGSFNFLPRNHFKRDSECLREPYNGTAELLDYFIESLIPARKGTKNYNPFYGKAESFIKIGQKYNIKPCRPGKKNAPKATDDCHNFHCRIFRGGIHAVHIPGTCRMSTSVYSRETISEATAGKDLPSMSMMRRAVDS